MKNQTKQVDDFRKALSTDFGKRLRKIRKNKGLSQLELAERCETDVRKIGGLERGEYDFRYSSILVLAKGLCVDVEELQDLEYMNTLKEYCLL